MRMQGAGYAGVQAIRRLLTAAVWLLEVVCEAIGTALLFFAIPASEHFVQIVHEFQVRQLIGLAIVVLIEFALTGYLVTTALASAFLRRRGRFVYPTACAGPYLIHSEIFFVAAGNRPFAKGGFNSALQLLGTVVAFVCALGGNWVLHRYKPEYGVKLWGWAE